MRYIPAIMALCLGITSAHAQTFRDAYDTAVLADAPLIYWRLNESQYSVAQDASGNSHDGTYTATSGNSVTLLQPPAFSTCGFSEVNRPPDDGVGKTIALADFSGMHLGTGNWSIELLWQTAAGSGVGACSADGAGLSKGSKTGGFPYITCGNDGVDNGPIIQIASTAFGPIHLTHDVWHHEVFVRTSTTALQWYTDNTNIGPLTISATASATNTDPLNAWFNSVAGGGGTNTYKLKLDNISFYDFALNSTQVGNHFAALSTTNICPGTPDTQYQVKLSPPTFFDLIRPVSLK